MHSTVFTISHQTKNIILKMQKTRKVLCLYCKELIYYSSMLIKSAKEADFFIICAIKENPYIIFS